jgi:hypothetical protein
MDDMWLFGAEEIEYNINEIVLLTARDVKFNR